LTFRGGCCESLEKRAEAKIADGEGDGEKKVAKMGREDKDASSATV
jgi:hypothetical protein